MGAFDSIANRLTGGKEDLAGAPKKLVEGALEMIDAQKDGLKGMVDKLSASGLGEQVKSWVSTGANLPVTAAQIKQALSSSELDMLALKTKLSVEEVTSHLAAALPQIVDKLTPDGMLTVGGLKEQARGLLGKLGFGDKQSG
jgi:uncharacterized protein YidB (DUF937 family)